MDPLAELRPGDALLIVDVQNDFCPGGALPIPGGDEVVPVLNAWLAATRRAHIPVYASRDWHHSGHVSFHESGGPWPPHCLQDTPGAEFHPDLDLPPDTVKITKGVRFDQDQNSAFDETGLEHELRRQGVRRLWIGGLAQDVCVLATALDALKKGFEVGVIRDATRGVTPDGYRRAEEQMRAAGARLV